MLASIFSKWTTFGGRIGRKEYWLIYMLPTGVLLSSSGLVHLPYAGWAALWFFTLGNVKRIRDLKVSGAAMGLWWIVMVVATVVAAGLFLFGLLAVMSNGGPDGEQLMLTAVIVFLAPIGILLLVAGFIPGLSVKQSGDPLSSGTDTDSYATDVGGPSKPLSKGMKIAIAGGVAFLIIGSFGNRSRAGFADRESALIQAVRSGQLQQVLDALEGGADPNQRTSHGTTVLQLAIEFGRTSTNSLEIATMLVENGADPSVYSLDETDAAMVFYGNGPVGEYNEQVPLARAAGYGDSRLVELMLERGASANLANSGYNQWTPLMAAVEGGHADVVSTLLSHGADDPDALRMAVDRRDLGTVDAFLEHGADVNAYFPGGGTALMTAVQGIVNLDMVRLLLARGADPHKMVRGVSPLMYVEDQRPLQTYAIRDRRDLLRLLRGGE